jgi:GntR family transcriptional regulator
MARFRLELGPIPLHHQVYLDLRNALDRGEWRPGDRLPPERELAVRYGCSLITVRHALGELAREQRIERTRGRGTFVAEPRIDRDFAGAMSFAEEMQRHGLVPETRLIAKRLEPAGDVVASALNVEPAASVVYLERLRMADGEPLILEQVRLPAARFGGLLEHDLERNSLYDVLADRFGSHVARAREAIEPVLVGSREAGLLGLKPRTPALLVEGTAYDQAGAPVEFARSYVRSDRTRYYLERTVSRPRWLRSWEPAEGRPADGEATAATARDGRGGRRVAHR